MAVIFPILSTFNAAGVNQAQRAFKGLSGVAKTGAIAFAALGTASLKFGADAVKAAAIDQKAQLKLAKTLQNVTKATTEQIAATEKFITSQQFATGVSDTQLRPALETLIRATGDVTKAQGLLGLGLDVAAGSGRDLESISLALAKAQGGQFTALQRLGIVIPDNIKKSKDFGKVQEYLNKLFGGQAAVAAGTFSGKLAIMRERLSEAQETIGGLLLPILTKLVDAFTNNVMPAIERVVKVIQFQGAGAGLQAIGVEISNVITNLEGTAKKIKDLIFIFIGIKTVAPLVYALRASWVATTAAIGATATATVVASTVMKRALISTGIGALIVAAGYLAAKVFEVATAANATDKEVRFMESNGVKSFQRFGTAADIARQNIDRNVVSLNAVSLAASRVADALDNAGIKRVKQGRIPVMTKVPSIDGISGGSKKAGKEAAKVAAMTKLVADTTKIATDALAKMNDKLTAARDKLTTAKDAFSAFSDGVRDSITGLLNFSDAAENGTGSFLKNLQDQAAGIVAFSGKIQQLIAAGLSESGIQQVLTAGAVAGGKIADELIAGGAGAISQTNDLLKSVESAAAALGKSGADAFYAAGVTQGQALVNGILAAVKTLGFGISGGAIVLPAKLQKALNSGKITKAEVGQVNTLMASGNKVTTASNSTVINLTVNAGVGTDGAQVGRAIVDAIKKYERTSGPVFKSA